MKTNFALMILSLTVFIISVINYYDRQATLEYRNDLPPVSSNIKQKTVLHNVSQGLYFVETRVYTSDSLGNLATIEYTDYDQVKFNKIDSALQSQMINAIKAKAVVDSVLKTQTTPHP